MVLVLGAGQCGDGIWNLEMEESKEKEWESSGVCGIVLRFEEGGGSGF